ncbi:GGDEF domain-containing protein [Sporosarcina oncorhynchi]|uniref:GGDEF domain-containing protein n=1 Tax=Sporosarcina oncorhynchi TaxID=3056444 RepID=A0ABZ0L856_9BACL|nr:GGDEF domain-containing protein [Sporosarcina sp. T2O-4]WOV88718.1 GGDEF domain-containing protein [Sporosarcina sp. T2O-4]
MLYNAKQKRVVLSIWFLLFPTILYVAYNFFPIGTINPLDISLNLLILIVIMMLPLRLESVTLTLERWILFYIFFHYGLIVEMIFMQIGMFVLLFSDKSSTPKVMRFSSNSIVFLLSSLISGSIYYGLGGVLMEQSLGKLVLLGFIYASSYSIINNLLLYINFKYVGHKVTGFLDSVVKDYFITIVLLPFAIALCLLTETLHNKAFLLVGMPCILLLLIAKKYVKSEGLNEVLTSSSEIGHQLAGNLSVSDVLDTFVMKLKTVLPYDNAYIVDLRGEKLVMLRIVEGGHNLKVAEFFDCPDLIKEGDGLNSNETNVYPSRKFIDKLERYDFAHEIQSLMTTPLKRNSVTEGFLFLTSSKKYIFTDLHAKMVDLLAGYVTASIDKAKYYEKTVEKSERCGLTGLNNYRYLERKLDEEMIRFHTKEIDTLSVIILDIDHFKSINDTYGHQSGNDILRAFADLLRQHVSGDATLARYGGEEFVILLPNVDKYDTYKLAETIRKQVDESVFKIIRDLSQDREEVDVHMTVSAGVASIPEDASDAKDLLRNADRGLYLGGKQAGRNRVGMYCNETGVNVEM